MKNIKKSEKIYLFIVLTMLLGKGIWSYYKLADPLVQRFINSWPMMILISFIGFICLKLADKTAFPEIWDEDVSNRDRFIIPALSGIFFALLQIIFFEMQGIKIPMLEFPISIPVYFSVGILSELVFHFIPLVFLMWLISYVIFKNRWGNYIFWTAAVLLSIWEPILQLNIMFRMGILINALFAASIFLLTFGANIIPVYFIKRYGLLAAIVWRLSDYLIWHILWGGFFL